MGGKTANRGGGLEKHSRAAHVDTRLHAENAYKGAQGPQHEVNTPSWRTQTGEQGGKPGKTLLIDPRGKPFHAQHRDSEAQDTRGRERSRMKGEDALEALERVGGGLP